MNMDNVAREELDNTYDPFTAYDIIVENGLWPTLLKDLAKICIEDSDRWFGDSGKVDDIVHHALSMCGEAGEVANIVKKIDRGSLSLDDKETFEHLAMELTDTLVYLLNIAGIMKIDLMVYFDIVRKANEKRFMAARAEREAHRDAKA